MPTIYDYRHANGTLGGFQERGAVRIRFWCLGESCNHWVEQEIGLLIEALGPSTSMVKLAKRAGPCKACGGRGAYVEAMWELPKGHTGYRANLEKVLLGLLAEVDYIKKRLY